MIDEWTITKKIESNEIIEKGKDDFVDDRGIISNYYLMIL